MKILILLSALAIIAIASPVQNQKSLDRSISSFKQFPATITRQKKSPGLDITNNENIEDNHHGALQTEPEETTAEARHVGLKKPVMLKNKFGYRGLRDSNEELSQVDAQENCKQQVRVRQCEEESKLIPQNMKFASAQERSDLFAPEKDMENSIKLAKEAVEKLQKDFVKIENSPNANTDLKPETDLHSNIDIARKALEHIHQSFGNLEPMSLKAMKNSNDNTQIKLDDEDRLNKWREAIEILKKRDGILRNVDDAVNAESQHTKSFLAKENDSTNLIAVHHLEPKTNNIQHEMISESLNNNDFTTQDVLNMEKSASNDNKDKQNDSSRQHENDTENTLKESTSDQEESKQKLELMKGATQNHLETEDKIRSTLDDLNDKNMLPDTKTSEMKSSSSLEPLKQQINEGESDQIQKLKPENINILNDQTFHVPAVDKKDIQTSSSEKSSLLDTNNKVNTKSTDFDEDHAERIRNKEITDSTDKQLNQNKLDEATLLKAAADKPHQTDLLNKRLIEHSSRNDDNQMINNANTENNKHFNEGHKLRLSHEDTKDIKDQKLRMPMTNDDRQNIHTVFNKPVIPVDHETQPTSTVLKSDNFNFGHNGLSEQFDMMPKQDKIIQPMNPHTLEDPTFMRWAHERQPNQMPHLHPQIPSAFHKEHLKSSLMDDHVHHMTDINSLDFPGHGHHEENHLFGSRLHHDHMHSIPQMKSSDMDSAPSMYMAMRDSLGRSAFDYNGMHWNHQGRSSYGAPSAPSSSTGTHSGAIGVFPNANVGGCAIPLLLSCSPNLVSGSLAKPSTPTYSAPAYRSGDDLTYFMKRDTKVNNEIPVIKVQRTTTPFNHKNEIVVDRQLM